MDLFVCACVCLSVFVDLFVCVCACVCVCAFVCLFDLGALFRYVSGCMCEVCLLKLCVYPFTHVRVNVSMCRHVCAHIMEYAFVSMNHTACDIGSAYRH